MIARLRSVAAKLDLFPILKRLGGRSFVLVIFFAITGYMLACRGKLTSDYAALVTALSGFHVWRSVMQDRNGDKGDPS